jgi:hypothetical protein
MEKNSQGSIMYLPDITQALKLHKRKQNTSTAEIACGSLVPINTASSLKMKLNNISKSKEAILKFGCGIFSATALQAIP